MHPCNTLTMTSARSTSVIPDIMDHMTVLNAAGAAYVLGCEVLLICTWPSERCAVPGLTACLASEK
jgi:hypothetical protein